MKKLISIIILVSIAASFAQAKFGMQMRMRSEIQNLNSTNSDKQIYDRRVDVRLRPDVEYTVNDYLSVKAVLEIGELQYGSAGGALNTDGKNLETKNIYIDVKPTKNHAFRLGLMPYKDAHSMILDTDLAGIMWMGQFEKYNVELGWFAASDDDEKYIIRDTYSFGTTLIGLNQTFHLNKNIDFGVYNLFVMSRTEFMSGVNRDYVRMFMAPRFKGVFGKFSVDAQFIANNNFADYDNVGANAQYQNQPWDPDRTGLGLSVKSKFDLDSKTTFRANFLFRGCYENYENYEGYKSFYDTGLEIINEDANGISSHNPMNEFVVYYYNVLTGESFTRQLGVIVPSIFVDWKFKDNVTFTGGFGFVMNDQSYEKPVDVHLNNGTLDFDINDDMFLAWELDLKAKIVMYENLDILPYVAFFIPTDNYAYNTINDQNDPINFKDGDPATDMQMKMGMTVNYNF